MYCTLSCSINKLFMVLLADVKYYNDKESGYVNVHSLTCKVIIKLCKPAFKLKSLFIMPTQLHKYA